MAASAAAAVAAAAAAALAALVAAGADPAAGASVVRFPPPATPGYGRLDTLCALQCAVPDAHTASLANVTLTATGGRCGAFPDQDALDTPPYSAADGATAAALAALINLHWPYAANRVASSATSTPLRVATPATRRTRDALAAAAAGAGRPPCAPSAAVPYAVDVAAALRLQRNSVGGAVARVNGKYEVLAVSRRTAGVCLDGECAAAAAVAMVGGGGGGAGGGRGGGGGGRPVWAHHLFVHLCGGGGDAGREFCRTRRGGPRRARVAAGFVVVGGGRIGGRGVAAGRAGGGVRV